MQPEVAQVGGKGRKMDIPMGGAVERKVVRVSEILVDRLELAWIPKCL